MINFHAAHNRQSYATREAAGSWKTLITMINEVQGLQVADIGCGGGIYARALLDMGAAHVTCIDSSEVMLNDAHQNLGARNNVTFLKGEALATGATDGQFDLVLERALIHHLSADALQACFTEAFRILKPGGKIIVQDRTPEDCLLPGSQTHIRGYFFALFPRLGDIEIARRHSNSMVLQALQQAGFRFPEKRLLWETRKLYSNFAALAEDLQARTGRSILHELQDEEVQKLISYIQQQLDSEHQAIIEQDRWTVWSARR